MDTIYSQNSIKKCIAKGFAYVMHQPWLITKVIGPWSALLACCLVVYKYLYDSIIVGALQNQQVELLDLVLFGIVFIICCASCQMFIARLFKFFYDRQKFAEQMIEREILNAQAKTIAKDQKKSETEPSENEEAKEALQPKNDKRNLMFFVKRTLPYSIWAYLFFAFTVFFSSWVFDGIKSLSSVTYQCGAVMVLLILVFLLYLTACVFAYPFYAASMQDNGKMSLREKIKTGYHYKWKTMTVLLIVQFTVALLCILSIIPALLSESAYLAYYEEIINYNVQCEIPSGGYILLFCVASISLFVTLMFSIIPYSTLLYLYGDIESSKTNATPTR